MTSEHSTSSAPSGGDAATTGKARKGAAVPPEQRYGKWRIVAAVAGLLGFVLACLTPFLPVKETTAAVHWPQNGRVANVDAPLVSYAPVRLDVSLPCSLVNELPRDGGTLLRTLPEDGPRPGLQGLAIKADTKNVIIADRDVALATANRADVARGGEGCAIGFVSTPEKTTASITGLPDGAHSSNEGHESVADPNLRPQITGFYTDLPDTASTAGIDVSTQVDTRFNTKPSTIKLIAIVVGIGSMLLSLVALGFLDLRDGRGHVRIMPPGWLRPRPVDFTVIGVLGIWWLIGPNTSDDGYQITMATQAKYSGYLINYFRSFGVPENPIGWNDYLFTAISHFTTAAPAMRLPGLAMGLLTWLIISREMIPRLGRAVRNNPAALWAGAGGFLLVWLPLNNGLRPEPVVVLFSLLTWVSVERSIATGRLLPVAIAVPCAALCVGAAPGGLIAVAALLAASRQIVTRIVKRRKRDGLLPLVAPILASGMAYLFYASFTPSFAALREAIKVKGITGPTLDWYEEGVRYYYLMLETEDGSAVRRIGVLTAFLCLLTVLTFMLRRKRPSGISAGPVWRLMAVFFATVVLLAFTPTKWTHHLGLFAGYAAGIAAVAATMTMAPMMRSKRNRVFFAAAALLVAAVSFAARVGYYWVGTYGIPWNNMPPELAGVKISWVLFAAAVITALYGLWLHYQRDYRPEPTKKASRGLPTLAILTMIMVLFDVSTMAKGAYAQRGSFSWTASNARALQGDTCSMADYVLMERDPNQGQLKPAPRPDGSVPTAAQALAGRSTGFTPTGVPSSVTPVKSNPGHNTDSTNMDVPEVVGGKRNPDPKTDGVPLPFGLNPATTPVLGSFGATGLANLTTDWYQLGPITDRTPLVTLSVAGSAAATGLNGVPRPGRTLMLEAGRRSADGAVQPLGRLAPLDAWSGADWRNLRFPTENLPRGANTVRVVIDDPVPSSEFVAITPPRMTTMSTAQEVFGRDTVVALDFMVAFAFPCQRQVRAVNGVFERPEYRIAPDAGATRTTSNTWQGWKTGGPLGVTDAMYHEQIVPSYLKGKWAMDWGTITRYTPWTKAEPAQLDIGSATRSGWYTPGPMRSADY
ncbi:arabinosyltransferase domain-containing protein [Tsukamurella sp. 1534]|uniref:arabinosyltransferase domain-containing protein n=1 Tax=Tsukamurella sp. 1534 TaxID=1151061 RepID=UPI0002FD42AE|nr:arabinosyltransferase domain-containing protein [Tsukamurella sp. 1534]